MPVKNEFQANTDSKNTTEVITLPIRHRRHIRYLLIYWARGGFYETSTARASHCRPRQAESSPKGGWAAKSRTRVQSAAAD